MMQWLWSRTFFKVFTIYRHVVHLGHVTWTKYKLSFPPLSTDCIWNLIEISLLVSEEESFENVDRQITSDLWPRSPNNLDL